MTAIFTVFETLDRAGPGTRESLDWALAVAGTPPDAVVLDAGCGPGADLAGLSAHVPRGRVVAVDLHPGFIARIRAAHPAVRAEVADMADPPGGPFGLIWSAGAIYNLGVTAALRGWRRHLAPGGRIVFSEIAWTVPAPSGAARAFWDAEGVAVGDAGSVRAEVAAAGYRVLADRWLPQAGWAAYYLPLAVRCAALRAADRSPEMVRCLDGFEQEIGIWQRHGTEYGYLQVVAEPA